MKVAEVSLQLLATGTAYLEAVNASVYLDSVKNFHYSIFCVMKAKPLTKDNCGSRHLLVSKSVVTETLVPAGGSG